MPLPLLPHQPVRQSVAGSTAGSIYEGASLLRRSAFSTLARDQGFARDVVELALDHAHDNEVARAYDRGERFTQRVQLFNWWGEQLAAAQRGAKIIPLSGKSEIAA